MTLAETWNPSGGWNSDSLLLRRALLLNAVFSLTNGLTLMVAGALLFQLFGIPKILPPAVAGAMLVLFGIVVAWSATRVTPPDGLVWTIIVLDFGWVGGTALVLLFLGLSPIGTASVVAVAAVVLFFGVAQTIGLRRVQ